MNLTHLKITHKLTMLATLSIILTVLIISALVGYQLQQLGNENVQSIAKNTAYHYASAIEAELEVPLGELRAIAHLFSTVALKVAMTRQGANLILKSFLEDRPGYLSIYLIFEPNAFDSQDVQYINRPEGDKMGRFASFWSRNFKGEMISESWLEKHETTYLALKKTKTETMLEPYRLSNQGQEKLVTSLLVPLLDQQQQFIGMAGLDISLEHLGEGFFKGKELSLQQAYVDFYSPQGMLAASSDAENLGKNVKEIYNHSQLIEAVLSQNEFSLHRISKKFQKPVLTYGSPIQIGNTSQPWIVTITVSTEELTQDIYHLLVLMILIGCAALLMATFSFYMFSRRLIAPLLKTIYQLKHLSLGQIVEEEIKYTAHDEIAELVSVMQKLKLAFKNIIVQTRAVAAGDYRQEVQLLSDQDQLGRALAEMTCNLREVTIKSTHQDWFKTGQMQLNDRLKGEQDVSTLAKKTIDFLTTYLEAQVGIFYLMHDSQELEIIASYAYTGHDHAPLRFALGEGLVGQAALEQKLLIRAHAPEEYTPIVQSGLASAIPHYVAIVPFLYEGMVKGVIEIGATLSFSEVQKKFLEQIMPNIGVALNVSQTRHQMQILLQQSQNQTKELQIQAEKLKTQQEELQHSNEELQAQSEELQTQQEELRHANEELELRTKELERQKDEIYKKNQSIEQAQQAIEAKAKELELASKYKSEFLANMSHELRTPLNSLLILSQLLVENKEGNLTSKQTQYAQTIYSAGVDLLTLINDILDLSKIEAGKLEVHGEEVFLKDLVEPIRREFQPLAEKKNIAFHVNLADNLPETLYTDGQRLKQIIKNLLSNALKFTEQGEVKLTIEYSRQVPHNMLVIRISDTGVGIPKDKQQIIFEAFQQADGTTNRRYGGTGLGLSISRQLARLLGGDIQVTSVPGEGSTFVFSFPEKLAGGIEDSVPTEILHDHENQDSSSELLEKDHRLLIIDKDEKFTTRIIELAQEKHFKCLIAHEAETGVQLAEKYPPDAIILDAHLFLSQEGHGLEKLKERAETRSIPIHVLSKDSQMLDIEKIGSMKRELQVVNFAKLGEAFKKINTQLTKKPKNLLVLTDQTERQEKILKVLEHEEEINIISACSQEEGLKCLKETTIDAMILDIGIGQDSGIDFFGQLSEQKVCIPTILYAERELTLFEKKILLFYEKNCLPGRNGRTTEQLLEEVTLFLHKVSTDLSKEECLLQTHHKEALLAHKQVLLVDDDIRNTFALSTVLSEKNMKVLSAKNGKEALKLLASHPEMDMVLMDIMMPEMDGYEAISKIRQQNQFRKLPIIALTAKAMKGDKNKCIEAGANDYLAKPVDIDKLLSLMRVWLYHR